MKFTLVSLLLVGLFTARSFAVSLTERVRLTIEHVDLKVILAPEGTNLLKFIVLDHDRATNYFTTNAVLVVAESSKLSVPEGFPELGPSGSDLWVLPASQNPLLLYLGINATGLPLSAQRLDLFLRRIDGPGHFLAWQFASAGGLAVSHSTRDGLTEADRFNPVVGGHEHHNLGFSTNGLFTLWFQARATVGGTNAWSPETPILFAVEPLPAIPAGPATLVASATELAGSLQLHLQGTPKAAYQVERSADLANWEPVTEVIASENPVSVTVPLPGHSTQWFFRARRP
jgi:hypothetical protein